MQSNKECMKDILRYISDNANVKIQPDDKNIVLPHIGLSEIISDVSKDDKYTKEEVVYNLLKCHKYHLIEASITFAN